MNQYFFANVDSWKCTLDIKLTSKASCTLGWHHTDGRPSWQFSKVNIIESSVSVHTVLEWVTMDAPSDTFCRLSKSRGGRTSDQFQAEAPMTNFVLICLVKCADVPVQCAHPSLKWCSCHPSCRCRTSPVCV